MAKQCTKYQMNICKDWKKYALHYKGHNLVKNQWTKPTVDFDLYLDIANQCTKYISNECLQAKKKIDSRIERAELLSNINPCFWLRFYVPLKNCSLIHGDFTIAGEGLQNLGLCSALRAFEQGDIFIVPHLLWHGSSVFPVLSDGPPHLVASYDTRGYVEDLF
jgi:hypothetical protein